MKLTQRFRNNAAIVIAIAATVFAAIFLLHSQGRIWWCKQGDYWLWSSEIFGSHNSQHFIDPYSFTHVLHGVMVFWVISIFLKKVPFRWQIFLAVLWGCSWEVFENSSFVIERYRGATISLDYFGDSIFNSLGDILSCAAGFLIARKLGFWKSLAFFAATEILLMFWIRDSLLINILMLIHPIEAVKVWQNS